MTTTAALDLTLSQNGSPWCRIAPEGINPDTLHLSRDGSPWWGLSGDDQQQITIHYGHIKRVIKVDFGHIKKITI